MSAPPSPSEFLTFYRRVVMHPGLRRSALTARQPTLRPVQAIYTRQLSLSSRLQKDNKKLSTDDHVDTNNYEGDRGAEHATEKAKKGDDYDVQSSNVKQGMRDKAKGTGGHATEERDSAGGVDKAKKEHPEAPDPAIGMQDERGGRGA